MSPVSRFKNSRSLLLETPLQSPKPETIVSSIIKMGTAAEKKLAKQLAREQMLNQIKRDTLAREAAMDKVTLTKLKEKWFNILVDTKVPEMQNNLRQILHYMEKLIETENFRKLLFEEEKKEMEEQVTTLAKGHETALETLFDIFEKRVGDLYDAYNNMVISRKDEADLELKTIEDHEKETQENMHTMLYQIQENKEKKEEMMNCDMFLKLDDERSKNTELQENLQIKLEKKMEKRWEEISTTLNNYENATRVRRRDYLVLKAKDDADSKIICQQVKKTQKLFEQLDELKNCLDECYAPKETMSFIRDLREERIKFLKIFKRLKRIVDEEIKEDQINLKDLTVLTNTLTEDLRKLCTKGEQILTLFRICRRFETEYEKVIPMGNPMNLTKVLAGVDLKRKGRPKHENEEAIISYQESSKLTKEFEVLENFWRKVGKARLSKAALNKCVNNLKKENQFLKDLLASYLKETKAHH